MSKYEAIAKYLDLLTHKYRLNITLNDFEGFLAFDSQLSQVFQPYMIHKNPYCMQIKSDKSLWDKCISMKSGLLEKSRKLKKCFYGMCYCGVEEYIVPIIKENIVIGVICVGEFSNNQRKSLHRLSKAAASSGMDRQLLEQKFQQSIPNSLSDTAEIEALLSIVAEYIGEMYSALADTYSNAHKSDKKSASSSTYILYHALEFIHQNFTENLAVMDICRFCHCSESYINHIFKKNMKVNVRAYINKMRVEQAKEYLLNTNLSIADIAIKVGYSDPNYFSLVFSKMYSISPTEYKKSNLQHTY